MGSKSPRLLLDIHIGCDESKITVLSFVHDLLYTTRASTTTIFVVDDSSVCDSFIERDISRCSPIASLTWSPPLSGMTKYIV